MKFIYTFLLLIIFNLLFSIFVRENNILNYIRLIEENSNFQVELNALKKRNADLLTQLSKLKNDQDYIEEYSRNKLGMFKPEETLYLLKEN